MLLKFYRKKSDLPILLLTTGYWCNWSCLNVTQGKNCAILYMLSFWTEPATRGVLCKKVFLEISKNSQENTCGRVPFLNTCSRVPTLLKKRLWHRCFPVNFVKFLRIPFYRTSLDDCFFMNILGCWIMHRFLIVADFSFS